MGLSKRLSNISWSKIVVLAMAWPLAWLLISAGTMVVAFRGAAANRSGGLAAIGFRVTPLDALLLLGPPLALLILRAIAPYIRSD